MQSSDLSDLIQILDGTYPSSALMNPIFIMILHDAFMFHLNNDSIDPSYGNPTMTDPRADKMVLVLKIDSA